MGGPGVRGMGALRGMEGSRIVLQHLCGGFGNRVPRRGIKFELEKAQTTNFHPISCFGKACPAISTRACSQQLCRCQAKGDAVLGSGQGGCRRLTVRCPAG